MPQEGETRPCGQCDQTATYSHNQALPGSRAHVTDPMAPGPGPTYKAGWFCASGEHYAAPDSPTPPQPGPILRFRRKHQHGSIDAQVYELGTLGLYIGSIESAGHAPTFLKGTATATMTKARVEQFVQENFPHACTDDACSAWHDMSHV